ncbi:hypothetical protein GCM10010104_33060 [Streptomyces indiaensis]|uniref:Leucine-binding protein domain-containing protein n=1 Tax=Streptomyces indiaensis TaxID=284033 RepID=A0ABN3DLH7_9ACTN
MGEDATPVEGIDPAVHEVLVDELVEVRRWFVVGNDYVWPRHTARSARHYARESGGRVAGEVYLPLGTEDFEPVLRHVERSDATRC